MKVLSKKFRFVLFSAIVLVVAGCLNNTSLLRFYNYADKVFAATIIVSEDGKWKFSTDGELYIYTGSETEVTLPEQLTSNGVTYNISKVTKFALLKNTTVTKINIGDNITFIADGSFMQMPNLEAIEVSETNTNYCDINGILYNKAQTILLRFPQKNPAQTMEFPDSFIKCDDDALEICPNIQTLVIPAIYTGEEGDQTCIFSQRMFPNLTTIEVEQGNANFSSESGILYNADKTKLAWYPPKKADTDFTIPNSVTTIECNAFLNAVNLQNINLSANITDIDIFAFTGCNLTSLNSITTRADYVNWNSPLKTVFQDNLAAFNTQPFSISLVEQEIQYAVDTYIEAGMSDYQKIYALYNYATNKVTYDSADMYAPENHCMSSLFLGNQTVCEGYALAMSLLLDKIGIPNCAVLNYNHAWDVLKLNDVWLLIDATWDDNDTEMAGKTYFLRTAAEYAPIHPAYTGICSSCLVSTNYSFGVDKSEYIDNLPVCDAIIGDLNMDGVLDSMDINCMGNEVQAYARYYQFGYYNVRADMNRDGAINQDDYNLLYEMVN
ncbi:leucine-rich repeat protein [Anaeromicropila populeti]|uniref:Leucine rich repeat-containing protein n=1 Tax=Anaeromicropila populeti TaxID=37658 RepID=A0A1I6ISQ2_9FIRM|nr:leucine-rich repeat protein [Anaeromicropila populeti]SFR69671.1 Leucine rich repeat-containing protein [Anaeromicropila populeti]